MNALFGPGIKGFLALLQAQDTLREKHGDGADWVCLLVSSKRSLKRYHVV